MQITYQYNINSFHLKTLNLALLNFFISVKYEFFSINVVFLPKKKNHTQKITVLKSPHIYKKARNQFNSTFFAFLFNLQIIIKDWLVFLFFFPKTFFFFFKNWYLFVLYKSYLLQQLLIKYIDQFFLKKIKNTSSFSNIKLFYKN